MSTKLVELRDDNPATLPFVLIQPGSHPPRTGDKYNLFVESTYHLEEILDIARGSEYIAVDFETRGADYTSDLEIVGMGLAWDTGSCYIDWQVARSRVMAIEDLLYNHLGLIAHNVYFDAGVLTREFGKLPKFHACTLALYSMLANESTERRWGLKSAQLEVLGWQETNEGDLDKWLVTNGYYKGPDRLPGTDLLALYEQGKIKPEKGEMWRAPAEILGKYCILDAESTYLLYTEVLQPTLAKFPEFQKYFLDDWMYLIHLLIDQKFLGIPLNLEKMEEYTAGRKQEIAEIEKQFLALPVLQQPLAEIEAELAQPKIDAQPNRLKKNKEISKNWLKWEETIIKICNREVPEYLFNINSGQQLQKLFYDKLGYPVLMRSDSGQPSVSKKALKKMGEPGQLLFRRADLVKELTYIDKYIEIARTREHHAIHPSFRIPGTVTGRLSSKDPNIQQIPKNRDVMDLFIAPEGYTWVDLDFAALEPVVATEFSRDPNMQAIYGNGVKPNDIYLFVASTVPAWSSKIAATGYDRYSPTPEGLARAKKECKHERSIAKTVVLACQYGAGVNKVMQTLEDDEIYLERHEVEAVHSGYWDTFRQVKQFARDLYLEWRDRDGYVLNGIGRPMCVPKNYEKDLLNRFIQSTGHDLLIKYISIYTRELTRRGIPWRPLIIDFHDASAVEVPDAYVEATIEVYKWGLEELNRQIGGEIQLRGTPSWGKSLSAIKEPES